MLLIPALGIADAYGGYTPEYHNALGFFVLRKLSSSAIAFTLLTVISSLGGLQPFFLVGQLHSVSIVVEFCELKANPASQKHCIHPPIPHTRALSHFRRCIQLRSGGWVR